MTVEERMSEYSDQEMAEATMMVFDWFGKKGRIAAQAVQELATDVGELEEGMSWLQDICDGKDL